MIAIRSVCKKFGKVEALSHLFLDFEAGKSYAVIGPNGSGKTTLIKSILGLVLPDVGMIECNGKNIARQWEYRQQIGYMPQMARFPEHIRVGRLIDMMKDLRGQGSTLDEELIDEFKINGIVDKRFFTLSGGTRQKVSAALTFLFSPSILVLDEPTAGLDPFAVEILKAKIQRERTMDKLFIITSHIMSDLDELASEVAYLDSGLLRYAGSLEELKKSTGEVKLGRAIVSMLGFKPENTPA